MDVEKDFKNLFGLVFEKARKSKEVIGMIQDARIIITEKIREKKESEIREEMQTHRDLMGLLYKIPQNDQIQKRTINLLVAQAMKENGNGQKNS